MLRCIRGIDGYLPVPVNRRLWNARPPMVSTSLSVEGAEGVESMTRLSKRAYLASIIHVVTMPVLLAMALPVGSQVPFQSNPQLPLDPIQLAVPLSIEGELVESFDPVARAADLATSLPRNWYVPFACNPFHPKVSVTGQILHQILFQRPLLAWVTNQSALLLAYFMLFIDARLLYSVTNASAGVQ